MGGPLRNGATKSGQWIAELFGAGHRNGKPRTWRGSGMRVAWVRGYIEELILTLEPL